MLFFGQISPHIPPFIKSENRKFKSNKLARDLVIDEEKKITK